MRLSSLAAKLPSFVVLLLVVGTSLGGGAPQFLKRPRRFVANPLETLRSFARDRLSGSRVFALYSRLRSRRSLPDDRSEDGRGGNDSKHIHGREIEGAANTLSNATSSTSVIPSDRQSADGNTSLVGEPPGARQYASVTTPRPWNPQGVPPPPSGPVKPVQPTLNIIPTLQVGVVPTGNRTSFFVGYYRPTQLGGGGSRRGVQFGVDGGGRVNLVPRVTTTFATYYPQYTGYYYPWYNYGSAFEFPFYTSFPGYVVAQTKQQPATYVRPQQISVVTQSSGNRQQPPLNLGGGNRDQRDQAGQADPVAAGTPNYAVFYRNQPGSAGTVQYSYVPVDEVVGGLRRALAQLFGALSRRMGSRTGQYVECTNCDQVGQVAQAVQKTAAVTRHIRRRHVATGAREASLLPPERPF